MSDEGVTAVVAAARALEVVDAIPQGIVVGPEGWGVLQAALTARDRSSDALDVTETLVRILRALVDEIDAEPIGSRAAYNDAVRFLGAYDGAHRQADQTRLVRSFAMTPVRRRRTAPKDGAK